MKQAIDYARTPHTQVAVIGGGTAGVFAAISAARSGAETVIVEKNAMLGGSINAGGINFPGLFYAWGKQIISGPCWEAILKTVELGGAVLPEFPPTQHEHWKQQILLNRFVFTQVITKMCLDAGVTLLNNAMVSWGQDTPEGVELLITDKSGLLKLEADNAIDATGDGNLCTILGYPADKSPEQQPATLRNHITGYCKDQIRDEDINKAVDDWNRAHPDRPPLYPGRIKQSFWTASVNNHTDSVDAETSQGRSAIDAAALQNLMDYYCCMRTIPGAEALTVDDMAVETGIRESVRVVGEAVYTGDDYQKGTRFPDSVCYSFYPIDIHVGDGIEMHYLDDGVLPSIPYGALVPKGAHHLLVAGRCISTDRQANAAIRVEAPCMATGQAAGCAAALASLHHSSVYPMDYDALSQALRAVGAIVPEK